MAMLSDGKRAHILVMVSDYHSDLVKYTLLAVVVAQWSFATNAGKDKRKRQTHLP